MKTRFVFAAIILAVLSAGAISGESGQPIINVVPKGTGAGQTGEVRFFELIANGNNHVALKAADSISANIVFVLPSADGTTGQVLKTDGAGNLAWADGSGSGAPTGPAGGDLTGTYPNPTVATLGAISGANLLNLNASAINSGTVDVLRLPTVDVAHGGSGLTSYAHANGILYAATGTSTGVSVAGTSGQVMTSNGGGSAPTFQSISSAGGPAGGDLSGTFPNPTVINGSNLGAATVPDSSLSSNVTLIGANPSITIAVSQAADTNVSIVSPGSSFGLHSGEIILLTGQTTSSQNGPWIFNSSSTPLSRPSFFKSGSIIPAYKVYTFDVISGSYSGYKFTGHESVAVTVDTTSYHPGFYSYNLSSVSGILVTPNGGLGTSITPTGGQIPIGNSLNYYIPTTVSGDATLTQPGVLTVNSGAHLGAATVPNSALSSNVTLQSNTFNGVSQLVKTDGAGKLPAIDGSQLTGVTSAAAFSAITGSSNTTAAMVVGTGASLAATGSGTITATAMPATGLTGTINDARQGANVTLQGNTFNGVSQLVQTDGAGKLPAIDGSQLTNLPGASTFDQIGSGTNTTAAMVVGTGSSLAATGSGSITATALPTTGLTGTLQAGQFPALTGNVTTTAGSLATTIAAGVVTNTMLAGSIAASNLIGTDIATLGTITSGTWNGTAIGDSYIASALTGKTYNGMTITSNSGTLHIANAKAFDVLHSLTLDGTDGSTLNVGSGGTLSAIATSGSATDLSAGTVAAARMPALTGDVTTSAGTVATTVGKINGVSMAGLATGILKNTTTTGVPSIAIAADFPPLNQSTTGSAATLTTPRSVYGNNFDGSADLNQIIGSGFGGTANGFTKFSGPTTSEKTFTLPNASSAILTDNAVVTVAQGGTGIPTTTAYSPVFTGTTGTGAWKADTGPGTSTYVLTSNGAGAYPTWQASASGSAAGSNKQIQFNNSGAFGASSTLVWDGTNFGIGTTTPITPLQVVGMGFFQGASSNINSGGGGNLAIYSTDSEAADLGASLALGGNITGTSTSAIFGYLAGRKENSTSTNQSGYLQFGVRNNTPTNIEAMRIASTGNVTIGSTSSPSLLNVGTSAQMQVDSSGNITSPKHNGVPGSGTNQPGGALYLAGGLSTGTGGAGDVFIQVPASSASGSSANTLQTLASFQVSGTQINTLLQNATTNSQAGLQLTLNAGNAVAASGGGTAGASAGGSVSIQSGNAARLTSGNAAGGDVNVICGSGVGTGVSGQLKVTTPTNVTGTINAGGMRLGPAGTQAERMGGSSKPTTRTDGSALADGDLWDEPGTGIAWEYNSSSGYWLSVQRFLLGYPTEANLTSTPTYWGVWNQSYDIWLTQWVGSATDSIAASNTNYWQYNLDTYTSAAVKTTIFHIDTKLWAGGTYQVITTSIGSLIDTSNTTNIAIIALGIVQGGSGGGARYGRVDVEYRWRHR